MGWQAWFTLLVVAASLFTMARGLRTPDVTLLAAAVLLALVGIITPTELLSGFSNPGMITIAALFVVAGALRETGALDTIGRHIFRRAKSERTVLGRLCPQVAALSAFLNNTAIVAMFMPLLIDWARRQRISPSRVLIPLSYAAVLGGTCTLIGTSTNLVVDGLMRQTPIPGAVGTSPDMVDESVRTADPPTLTPIGFFELAWVGIPATIIGLLYVLLVGKRLMPHRGEWPEDIGASARQYLVNMRIAPSSPLIGKRVKEAGLRRLPGLFLIEITRGGSIIAPVAPNELLQSGDRLSFTGLRSTIVDLERFPGLERVDPNPDTLDAADDPDRYYTEAVVSSTSPLIGKNIRDANFRALYNAVVVAVHRGGAALTGRVGDIVLRAGDTLLLQTGPNFITAHANNPDFYLVSGVSDARPIRRERAWLSMVLLALFIVLLVTRIVPVVVAAMLAAAAFVWGRCISGGQARRTINWSVLLTIAAALAVGQALVSSGAASEIGHAIVSLTSSLGPVAALAVVYLVAMLFTEMLTNSAAAALAFPLAMTVSNELGLDPRPFAMAVVFGASFGFATPIGYQTNLMVYGPGGYRYSDFLRIGLPLNLTLWVLATILIPRVWPLTAAGETLATPTP